MIKQLAVILLLAVLLCAQEKQPPPPPPPPAGVTYQLEFTFTEMDGAKKVQSRNYTMLISEGRNARLRVGSKIPLVTGTTAGVEQLQYMDVGANIDARAEAGDARTVRLDTRLEVTGLASGEISRRPVLRNFNNAVVATVPLEKSTLLTSQDEPGTSTTFQVHVVARIAK
jgi:hypothetical protein